VDCNAGPDSDKEGFVALVKELSVAFRAKGLLLSSAVSPSKVVIDVGKVEHCFREMYKGIDIVGGVEWEEIGWVGHVVGMDQGKNS
jgi:hypothetical protein